VSDLIIGSRRPARARSVRSLVIIAVLLAASALLAYVFYRRVASYDHPSGQAPREELLMDATEPEAGLSYGQARLQYRGPLALLRLAGGVHDLGAQHGRLLTTALDRTRNALQRNVEASVDDSGFLGSALHNIRLRWRWRALDDGIPGQQLVELAGLIRGAHQSGLSLSYEDAVRQSAVLDIGRAAPTSAGAESWTISRALTAVVETNSPTGNHMIAARTVSLPGLYDGGASIRDNPVVFIVHPDGALPFASLAWPGMTGVISGVNVDGLGVFVHNLRSADVRVTRKAQPTPLLAREILESAHSMQEAIQILEHADPLGAAVFVIVDGKDRSWAAVERTPTSFKVRKAPSSRVVVDAFESKELLEDPINDRSLRTRPLQQRRSRARELLHESMSGPADVAAFLRDHSRTGDTNLPIGHRGTIDDPEAIHSALFDVSGMVLWVSDSGDASGRFRAIDLRHELALEGKAPAPPADIAAMSADTSARDAVRRARQLLLLSRRAAHAGHIARARELALHALSLDPQLPEALLVAGQLAHRDHDELAARPLLHRFLELGADDLRAEEQVKAWLGDL
jgi:hypothetical protein